MFVAVVGRRDLTIGRAVEPGIVEPAGDLLGSEAETPMGLRLAQEFQPVRREIDHQNAPAGRHEARCLADRAGRIIEVVENLMDDDEIEHIARERRRINVALPKLDAGQAGLFEIGARDRQHRVARVQSDGARCARSQQLEHAAGAGAEIEQIDDRLVAKRFENRVLDHVLGRMKGAQAVPFGRKAREEGLRRMGPLRAHGLQTGAIVQQQRIGAVEAVQHRSQGPGRGATIRQAKEGPRSLTVALYEPGLGQKLEVAGNPGLRLAENIGEIGDGKLAIAAGAPGSAGASPRRQRAGC